MAQRLVYILRMVPVRSTKGEEMATQEERIAKFKALRLREQEEAQKRLRSAVEHGIKYSADHRSQNLRLLRAFFNEAQDDFAELLGVGSQSQYSLLERGGRDFSAREARRIERELGIPDNWFDRSNSNFLFLSQDQLSLINEIQGVNPDAALKLADVVKLLSGCDAYGDKNSKFEIAPR
jgi:transcriptional regulator with XRE-family HTH domain